MPRKKAINEKNLIKLIQDGVEQAEIMSKFGFKNSNQLKVAYANALMSTGTVPELKKAGRKSAKPVATMVAVNKRGSLVIPKALIESFGIKVGESFEVKYTRAAIRLKKV
jgi:hypothetical protein